MTTRSRLTTLAIAAGCLAALAPSAYAAKPSGAPTLSGDTYVVPPGKTIWFNYPSIDSCNSDVAGIELNEGGGVSNYQLWSNSASLCTATTRSGGLGIRNTRTFDVMVRLWLRDDTCGTTYFAGGDHWSASSKSTALNDGGANCLNAFAPSVPKGSHPSFSVKVSLG